jgi:hypothetical protein
MSEPEVVRIFRTFNAASEAFRAESERHEPGPYPGEVDLGGRPEADAPVRPTGEVTP